MKITYTDTSLPYTPDSLDFLVHDLDRKKGIYMASGTDYPGRYSRWDIGFENPPVEVTGYADCTEFLALNDRGERILSQIHQIFNEHPDNAFHVQAISPRLLRCLIARSDLPFTEEARSQQPSPLSPLRHLMRCIKGADDFAGFYGAFKYDLLFSFNPIHLKHPRPEKHSLFCLFIPDRIYILDRRKETIFRRDYEFGYNDNTTSGMEFAMEDAGKQPDENIAGAITSNLTDEAYAELAGKAKEHIRKGNVFEVVISRKFSAPYKGSAAALFRNIRRINPSPYEFFVQMGAEQLVGASPEMFVRVEGRRVESCPIAGTARRSKTSGQAAVLEDAAILQSLLNSRKDEAELTMCTDVDRNDKARICEPGSVRVLARRQIEAYTSLYHTVDHVEGILREGFNGIDAFLSHMWAVTLTGAPKMSAAKIIEDLEPAIRDFYGAAVGALHFNGNINTGITIRTLHLKDGMACYQAGAGIVYDSVPTEEAAETHTKSAILGRILSSNAVKPPEYAVEKSGTGKTVILIDNEDSFVQTLADYIRQTGAEALTYRHGQSLETLLNHRPHLIVHSPGPGVPSQFGVPSLIKQLAAAGVPQFGICLGLQGMFEAFDGKLDYLPAPHHGKTWRLHHEGHPLFTDVPNLSAVGAYHSIYGVANTLPDELAVIGSNEDGIIMALSHKELPVWAVQFHPESILSMQGYAGHKIIANVMQFLARGA